MSVSVTVDEYISDYHNFAWGMCGVF